MAMMGKLRMILGGRREKTLSDPVEESPQRTAGLGTQAEKLVEVILASDEDSSSLPSVVKNLPPTPTAPESISAAEFRKAIESLIERIESLRQQLAFQSGHFDEINQRIVHLEDALKVEHQFDPLVERLTQSMNELNASQVEHLRAVQEDIGRLGQTADTLASGLDEARQRQSDQDARLDELNTSLLGLPAMKEVIDRLDASANHLMGRLAEVQQHQDRHAEQFDFQRDALQTMMKNTARLEQSQKDMTDSMQSTMERLANEVSAVDRRSASMRTVTVLAAVAATTAALLALIGLISS